MFSQLRKEEKKHVTNVLTGSKMFNGNFEYAAKPAVQLLTTVLLKTKALIYIQMFIEMH